MKYQANNFMSGQQIKPTGTRRLDIDNPQTGEIIAKMTCSTKTDVNHAVEIAKEAQKNWGSNTYKARAQVFFKYRQLLQENFDELAALCSEENGKLLAEGAAEIAKAIELCELAVSIPQTLNDRRQVISNGIECKEQKTPLGVVASIVPLNFPIMVPHWSIPMALVLGNSMIVKPSERVPLSCIRVAELLKKAGLPDGVFNVVQGDSDVVEAICDHEDIKAVSFVGSTPIAKVVYERTAKSGKRCIALGGAKNNLLLLPDADIEMAAADIVASFTGCAGQRCMAASLLIAVGDTQGIIDKVVEESKKITAGQNLGAIITKESKDRIESYITKAEDAGCKILLDGRNAVVKGGEKGYYVNPTIIDGAEFGQPWSCDEIFGPVVTIIRVKTVEEAIKIQNSSNYGNGASVYTQDGEAATYVADRLTAGMCGINIGVPVPREPFGFGGWKDSRFGVSDITGSQPIDFWTQTKKITTKWNAKHKKDWMS
ncbi:CoA-acylating methylmalonate-semialdehyde dehydrogenase [Francisella adeliensis]|uniref:CoA-acylating methylmalonate-semialdehyde dehydrogenase n=1 Tax=Francisella adeliensis TaxID=2007306 RepID=A0A2Z4XWB0_9GAMM|nr:CoA-acylating methylmalonate-semialdehyde dehydrogenase [Francisella adeliensis]AXA32908.1 methylmalonate-semialdehyde dehydrogenase (CoA acylating) [Francisella adeliensis]MBK2086407.1 CoA-acylating methylmalonate-semialdehyde dehydrogenase [Francisella adeliensis]MBK2096622.1 CoA-acylating methylmalonate-semialdehyde dehydrogenase [Francisella adeliensis]QIW11134.1 CoA-acylating methylmalonate-semialdehyde dehydrogenase [Francisella adeliensis]QIW13011.1 CoA-acylating methylmalonate-semia